MAEEPESKRVKLSEHHVDGQPTLPPTEIEIAEREPKEEEGDEDGAPVEEEETGDTQIACFTKETDVGIEQYLSSSHKGFFAILKQRYAFHERGKGGGGGAYALAVWHVATR